MDINQDNNNQSIHNYIIWLQDYSKSRYNFDDSQEYINIESPENVKRIKKLCNFFELVSEYANDKGITPIIKDYNFFKSLSFLIKDKNSFYSLGVITGEKLVFFYSLNFSKEDSPYIDLEDFEQSFIKSDGEKSKEYIRK